MWYSTRPPDRKSCDVTVAAYVGGPHQRSSWRGSDHSCQTPWGGSSNAGKGEGAGGLVSLRPAVKVIGLPPPCPTLRQGGRSCDRPGPATAPRTGPAGG